MSEGPYGTSLANWLMKNYCNEDPVPPEKPIKKSLCDGYYKTTSVVI